MKDFFDELFPHGPALKHERPHPDLCLHKRGMTKCIRIHRSWRRGRIGDAEARRRFQVNYKRTGAYFGPIGWCDEDDE